VVLLFDGTLMVPSDLATLRPCFGLKKQHKKVYHTSDYFHATAAGFTSRL